MTAMDLVTTPHELTTAPIAAVVLDLEGRPWEHTPGGRWLNVRLRPLTPTLLWDRGPLWWIVRDPIPYLCRRVASTGDIRHGLTVCGLTHGHTGPHEYAPPRPPRHG